MMFERISVLVPTRKRPTELGRLLTSFHATRGHEDLSEMVFRVDADDRETQGFLFDHPELQPFGLIIGPRLDGYTSIPMFLEELRAAATGDVLMCGSDDMIFRTPLWPQILLAEADKYPDGLFILGVETLNADHYPFPMISEWAAEAMGHLLDPTIYWGDVYLRDIMAAFGRTVRVPGVRIEHDWMGHKPDQTFREANQGDGAHWNKAYWAHHRACVDRAVAKLRAAQQQRGAA